MRIPKWVQDCIKSNRLFWYCAPYIRGMLSYISPALVMKAGGNTASSRYCYSVFMRHLVHLHNNGMEVLPHRVAEFGPGDTIGVGLCAILTGVNEYYALDAVAHTNINRNIVIFDDLVEMFMSRTKIPDDNEFPQLYPRLSDYRFPEHILTDDILANSLCSQRITQISRILRDEAMYDTDITIQYIAPWSETVVGILPEVNMVLSAACLEHVDEISLAYEVMYKILSTNGYISHSIDLSSHDMTPAWNGHWAKSDKHWKLIRGKMAYLINREPLSFHLKLVENSGFKILETQRYATEKLSIKREKLRGRFSKILDDDFTTSNCYIVARK